MNRHTRRIALRLALPCVLAIASLSHAAAAPSPSQSSGQPPVRLNPRIMLSAGEAARLQAAADQGMTSLRRYVWRTRMIYNYLMSDLI